MIHLYAIFRYVILYDVNKVGQATNLIINQNCRVIKEYYVYTMSNVYSTLFYSIIFYSILFYSTSIEMLNAECWCPMISSLHIIKL